jgi:hypothetical protein
MLPQKPSGRLNPHTIRKHTMGLDQNKAPITKALRGRPERLPMPHHTSANLLPQPSKRLITHRELLEEKKIIRGGLSPGQQGLEFHSLRQPLHVQADGPQFGRIRVGHEWA